MTKAATKRKGPGRPSKHPGITVHAERLGVSHSHLWRVLNGQRSSRSLLVRYFTLRKAESKGAA